MLYDFHRHWDQSPLVLTDEYSDTERPVRWISSFNWSTNHFTVHLQKQAIKYMCYNTHFPDVCKEISSAAQGLVTKPLMSDDRQSGWAPPQNNVHIVITKKPTDGSQAIAGHSLKTLVIPITWTQILTITKSPPLALLRVLRSKTWHPFMSPQNRQQVSRFCSNWV